MLVAGQRLKTGLGSATGVILQRSEQPQQHPQPLHGTGGPEPPAWVSVPPGMAEREMELPAWGQCCACSCPLFIAFPMLCPCPRLINCCSR